MPPPSPSPIRVASVQATPVFRDRDAGAAVVRGIDERDEAGTGTTLYDSLLAIGRDGRFLAGPLTEGEE